MKRKMAEEQKNRNETDDELEKNEVEHPDTESPENEIEAEGVETLEEIKLKLDEKSKQCDNYFNMLQRTAAEFDNYKKRTAREKEALYSDALCDAVLSILPGIDSLEKAVCSASGDDGGQSVKEGVELVLRQLRDSIKALGVEEIKSIGEKFDPALHEAVMHVSDESENSNVIVEEFRRGYIFKDRVIRHSMVKVLN